MKRLIAIVLMLMMLLPVVCYAEEQTTLIVTASILNGRAKPKRTASVEAFFDEGDTLTALGWSKNHHWIEVKGGETGTVWVWWEYVTERTDEVMMWNCSGSKVKIRKEPYGTVIAHLKKDGEVLIEQVLFGWGRCKQGWIDLQYLMEED